MCNLNPSLCHTPKIHIFFYLLSHTVDNCCGSGVPLSPRHDQSVDAHLQLWGISSEIKQKQSEYDSHRNTNSVCDSGGDSLLPTRSAHSIIRFRNAPGANDCRGRRPGRVRCGPDDERGLVYAACGRMGKTGLHGRSKVSLITK